MCLTRRSPIRKEYPLLTLCHLQSRPRYNFLPLEVAVDSEHTTCDDVIAVTDRWWAGLEKARQSARNDTSSEELFLNGHV